MGCFVCVLFCWKQQQFFIFEGDVFLTPEGKAKTTILRYLERRGFFAWNNPTVAVRIASELFQDEKGRP